MCFEKPVLLFLRVATSVWLTEMPDSCFLLAPRIERTFVDRRCWCSCWASVCTCFHSRRWESHPLLGAFRGLSICKLSVFDTIDHPIWIGQLKELNNTVACCPYPTCCVVEFEWSIGFERSFNFSIVHFWVLKRLFVVSWCLFWLLQMRFVMHVDRLNFEEKEN